MLINRQTDETFVKHLTPEQEKDTSHFVDKETGSLQRSLLAAVTQLTCCVAPQAWSSNRRRSCRCWSGSQTSTSASDASLSTCAPRSAAAPFTDAGCAGL